MAKRKKKKNPVTLRQQQQRAVERNQESTPGIVAAAGEVTASEYDKLALDTLLQDVTDMRNGDAIPSTTLDVLKLPIQHSEVRIEPGTVREGELDRTQEAADYIAWWLENLYNGTTSPAGFDYFKRHQLLALDYGHIIFEEVLARGIEYNPAQGKRQITNIITRFAPIQYDGICGYYYNEQMDFDYIEHYRIGPTGHGEQFPITSDKLYVYSHNEEFGDVRGRSELRTARLAWTLKQKVLTGGARAIQRGVLPIITITNPALKAKAQEIGRTLGNTDMTFVVQEKDKVSVEMAEVKNQGNLMEMLSYLDRQMFFNTLSQFMTSGLGENGSRAATSELKSSYELKANAILQEFEVNMQTRVNKAMSISYLAGIPKHQWPVFHLGAITQADLSAMSSNLKTMADAGGITFTDEDEKFFREMFGMPEAKITQKIEDDQAEDVASNGPDNALTGEELKKRAHSQLEGKAAPDGAVSEYARELTTFEREVFEFESATNAFKKNKEAIEKAIQDEVEDAMKDFAGQLKGDRTRRLVSKAHQHRLFNTLLDFYNEGYDSGARDVEKEIAKLEKRGTELAVPKKIERQVRKSLQKSVEKLFVRIEGIIETQMAQVSDKFIEKKGGLGEYLVSLGEGFKGDKRFLTVETQAGYTDGRGATMQELATPGTRFFYSAILDKNLCDQCSPVDGTIFTQEEIEENGLNFTQPINPDCLGGAQCRCQWIVQSIGGEA
jgi:hypothetical protein